MVNGYATTLGWKFSYKETLQQTLFDWSWILFKNKQKSFFEPPFGVLMGNVRTPSIALWRARGRLSIRHDWTFLAICYGWDVIIENLSKSAFFEGGWSLWMQISDGR